MAEHLAQGRYRLDSQLASGGMASVWLAHDEQLDVQRAVKILDPRLTSDPAFRERFRREARIMARLRHPNLVAVHDLGEDDGRVYIVMDLLTGGSLRDRMKAAIPLEERQAAELTIGVLAGLSQVHDAGVVHRDIKPDNVLLDGMGRPHLTDFGIAQAEETSAHPTQTGARMGTFAYMAPEQLQDSKSVDVRADVYSIGATLCALFTGKDPFGLRDSEGRSELLAAVPEALRSVVDHATRWSPDERPPSAAALAAELGQAAGITAATVVSSPPSAHSPRKRTWPLVAGAALALVTASVLLWPTADEPETAPAPATELAPVAAAEPPAEAQAEPPADPPAEPPAEPEAAPKTGPPAGQAADPTTTTRPAAAAAPPPRTAPPAVETTSAGESAVASATLGVNSFPSAEVTVDGKPKGRTPWQGTVSAGTRSVALETTDGKQKTLTVPLDGSGPVVVCWDFRKNAECRR